MGAENQNGVDVAVKEKKTTPLSKAPQNGKAIEPTKKPIAKQTEKPQMPSIEDTIRRVSQLSSLCEQRSRLIEARKNIDGFTFGSDGRQDCLVINDGDGKQFQTTNSDVIRMVAELIGSKIDQRMVTVENQINL